MSLLDDATPTAVYRFYDADERLLYVGITDEPKRRWRWHSKNAIWWQYAERRVTVWYDNREAAALEEKRAIFEESPLYNIIGVSQGVRPRTDDRVTIRLDPDDWAAFDVAVKSIGYRSRNAYIDDVLAWVLRKPGARTPRRPPAHDGSRPE